MFDVLFRLRERRTSNIQHRTRNAEPEEPLTLSLSPEYRGEGIRTGPEFTPSSTLRPRRLDGPLRDGHRLDRDLAGFGGLFLHLPRRVAPEQDEDHQADRRPDR